MSMRRADFAQLLIRATKWHLAREGAHVIVNARSNQAEADAVVREAQALSVRAISILADMAKKEQVEAMAAKALSEFGRVDILINNAAIRPHMPFRELTDEDWEHVRNVVLDGALYLTRALIGPMVENKYGNILFFEMVRTPSACASRTTASASAWLERALSRQSGGQRMACDPLGVLGRGHGSVR